MDAYCDYILQLSNDRARELRREAWEHALSRAARTGRRSLLSRLRRRVAVPGSVVVVGLPAAPVEPAPEPARRSA